MTSKKISKRIGITGQKGFIGKAVAEALVAAGYEVLGLDKYLLKKDFDSRDISEKSKDMDWVIHFAAKTSIENSFKDPFYVYENNIESTLRALKVAQASGASFLYMSSYIYGVPEYLPVDEKHPVRICNPYMGSKAIAEELARDICGYLKKQLVVLRGFTIYGGMEKKGRLIPSLIRSVQKHEPLVLNDASPRRDYLYIKDFFGLILKIIQKKEKKSGIYNVGYGKSYSNLEVVEKVAELSGKKMRIIVKKKRRTNDILDCRADIRLVSRTFSWKPVYSLEKGLAELLKPGR